MKVERAVPSALSTGRSKIAAWGQAAPPPIAWVRVEKYRQNVHSQRSGVGGIVGATNRDSPEARRGPRSFGPEYAGRSQAAPVMIKRMLLMLLAMTLIVGGILGYKLFGRHMMNKSLAAQKPPPADNSGSWKNRRKWKPSPEFA